MRTVWLVRHGESVANAGMPTSNEVTTPLTEKGFAQAERLAAIFDEPPSLIVESPYLRSRQFARPLRERFSRLRAEEWPVHSLVCLSPARFSDRSFEERRPFVEEYWNRCDPRYVDGHDAESFSGFISRASDTIKRLQSLEDDFIVIVTHQLFMQAVIGGLLIDSFDPTPECMRFHNVLRRTLRIPNGARVVISWDERGDVALSQVSADV